MLSAERLCELPLDVRVLIANMDMEVYIRMYLYDDEFRLYADGAVAEFIERFVVKRKDSYIEYRIGNVKYIKYDDGSEYWYKDDMLHRENGPAIIYSNGETHWCIDGKSHRLDGPAVISANGSEYWYVDGNLHRDDGPALLYSCGDVHWYNNGKLHRLDGPAVISANGEEYWYVDDKRQDL
jgi:hypothetical protein